MTKVIATLLLMASLVVGGPALAQSSGEGRLTVDGEEFAVKVVASQSNWGGAGWHKSVNIEMFAPEALEKIRLLRVWFEIENDVPKPDLVHLAVREGDEIIRLLGSDETGYVVDLEKAELDGSTFSVIGRFKATVGESSDFGRTIDLSNSKEVSGEFSVILNKAN